MVLPTRSAPAVLLLTAALFAADPALRTRTEVQDDYVQNYLGSALTTAGLGWTGALSPCNPGVLSAQAHARTLQRINYFRRMCGLRDSVTLHPDYNAKCQDMALMIDVKDSLSHAPTASWPCYTASGAEAAGKSNLSWNNHSVNAVMSQMRDNGTSNTAAGHRRWILYSRARIFGHGSTPGACCLWVLGNSGNPIPASQPAFTAYPPAGFVPAPLVYPRWSFGIPGADFRSAAVTMKTASGAAISLARETVSHNSYGDNTLVWQPSGISLTGPADLICSVTVSGVLSAPKTSYTYGVTLFQPVTTEAVSAGTPELPIRLHCAPNPFTGSAFLTFATKDAAGLLRLFSPDGRLILERAVRGRGGLTWSAAGRPAGIYLCRLEAAGAVATRVLAVVR